MDVSALIKTKRNRKIPDIAPGDTVRVSARIVEGGKERIQVFQGVVLAIKRGGNGGSFTVRHVAYGIGVERTFPFNSPLVEKVEIVRQGKVRRSRLYYLRGLSGKAARRKIKRVERKARQVGEELIEVEPEEDLAPEDVLVAETEEAEEATEATTEQAAEAEAEIATEEAAEAEVKTEEPAAEEAPETEAEEPAAEAEVKTEEAPEAKAEEPAAEAPAEEPVAEAEEKPAEAAAPEEAPEAKVKEENPADEEPKESA